MENIFKMVKPNWDFIPNVQAFTILAKSVGDKIVTFSSDSEAAILYRRKIEELIMPIKPIHWLKQIHSDIIISLPNSTVVEADGSFTKDPGIICAVRTADCLPIVFSNAQGTMVGIVHAGWKGLYKDIIYRFIEKFEETPNNIYAWIGPGISQISYEVGQEVKDLFIQKDTKFRSDFKEGKAGRFHADLYQIAKYQLMDCGLQLQNISGAIWDTFTDSSLHSARRDGEKSGRMATIIYIKS